MKRELSKFTELMEQLYWDDIPEEMSSMLTSKPHDLTTSMKKVTFRSLTPDSKEFLKKLKKYDIVSLWGKLPEHHLDQFKNKPKDTIFLFEVDRHDADKEYPMGTYLINTEGYGYPRYWLKIGGKIS